MRVLATGGIIGLATILGAVLVSQDVAGWIVGLAVGLTSVILDAVLCGHHDSCIDAHSPSCREPIRFFTAVVDYGFDSAPELVRRRFRVPWISRRFMQMGCSVADEQRGVGGEEPQP